MPRHRFVLVNLLFFATLVPLAAPAPAVAEAGDVQVGFGLFYRFGWMINYSVRDEWHVQLWALPLPPGSVYEFSVAYGDQDDDRANLFRLGILSAERNPDRVTAESDSTTSDAGEDWVAPLHLVIGYDHQIKNGSWTWGLGAATFLRVRGERIFPPFLPIPDIGARKMWD